MNSYFLYLLSVQVSPGEGSPLCCPYLGAYRNHLGNIRPSNARNILFIPLIKLFSSHFYILIDLYFVLFQGDFKAAYENT